MANHQEPTRGAEDARRQDAVPAQPETRKEHSFSSRSKKAKRRHKYDSSSEESNEDTDGSSSDSISSYDGERRRRRQSKHHGPTGRTKVGRFGNLRELKPTNSLYKELLSYRYYRLNSTSQKRTTKQTAKVSSFIERMELTSMGHRFDGYDPIKVLDFLSRFVSESNVLGMSEGQANLALPKVLLGFASFFVATTAGNDHADFEWFMIPALSILSNSSLMTAVCRGGRHLKPEWIGLSSVSSKLCETETFAGRISSRDQATTPESRNADPIFCWTFSGR